MKPEIVIALIAKLVDEKLQQQLPTVVRGERGLRGPQGERGETGAPGRDGRDFSIEDHGPAIQRWIKESAKTLADLTPEEIELLRGPQGTPGRDGRPGRDFDMEEHAEVIQKWIKDSALKFSDLTEKERDSLRGASGADGKDEHAEEIRAMVEAATPKFEDFTPEQIEALRGPKGRDGRDGRGFDFEAHADEISAAIFEQIRNLAPDLKLKFSDLSDEERESLRGPPGPRGRAGKSFVLEEHREFFENLKLRFSDLTAEEKESLRLRFADLTDEERESLSLRFHHLTEDQVAELRGPRGLRGQRGRPGDRGERGEKGDRGEQGPPGPRGLQGMPGLTGLRGSPGQNGQDGRDGIDGKDAPRIIDVSVEQSKTRFEIVFKFDDGKILRTNPVKIPGGGIAYINNIIGASGSGSGGTGADGKSAYEIWIEAGNTGTVQDFLDSLVGPQGPAGPAGADGADGADGAPGPQGPAGADGADGADGAPGSQYLFGSGVPSNALGVDGDIYQDTDTEDQYKKIAGSWVFQNTIASGGGGGGGLQVLENVPCDASVYVGAAVRMAVSNVVPVMMSDWTTLAELSSLDITTYDAAAVNALADAFANSNVIGLVESKPTSTTCNIRIAGLTAANYFGLSVFDEYYLSSTQPGRIVTLAEAPVNPGEVLVRIGQPYSSTRLLYQRGDRIVRGA